MDDSPCKERNFKMKFRVSYLIGGEVLIFVHSYNVPCRFRRKITFCLRLPNGHVFLGTLANMDIRYDLTIWSRRNSASLFVSHRPSWMNSPTFTNFYFRINGLVSENLSKSTLSNPIIPPEKKIAASIIDLPDNVCFNPVFYLHKFPPGIGLRSVNSFNNRVYSGTIFSHNKWGPKRLLGH